MSEPPPPSREDRELCRAAEEFGELALQGVCAAAPYLAGLASLVQLTADVRIPTAGVFASGRVLVHPRWFLELDLRDAVFVLTHELMHLVLRTHARMEGEDGALFNFAHDFVINDLLRTDLGMPIPAGGLDLPGARARTAEELVAELRQRRRQGRALIEMCEMAGGYPGSGDPGAVNQAMADALRASGWADPQPRAPASVLLAGDVLSSTQEKSWFSLPDSRAYCRRLQEVEACSRAALHLHRLDGCLREHMEMRRGTAPGHRGTLVDALRSLYLPPWELALQQWMEAVAPGPRTYTRPSRRGADRLDVVLPGRKREDWTLHLVLDTSGSMTHTQSSVLGVIAAFCETTGVGHVHIVQCDTRVTADEWLDPADLARYAVHGFGGSDMSPAMLHLAADPEVEAVLVVTDGCISYPATPPPYSVLWAVCYPHPFTANYGRVLPCFPALPVSR